MRRRRYLAATAGTVAAFAGCTTPNDYSSGSVPTDIEGPDVALGNDWEQVDSWNDVAAESTLGVDACVKAEVYENVALQEDLIEKTLGNFDQTAMLFFAARIEFDGILGFAARASHIEKAGLPLVEEQLHNHGLSNVHERSSVDDPKPDRGFRSEIRGYSGTHLVEGLEREVKIEGVGTVPLSIDDVPLEIRTIVCSWRSGTDEGFFAGGAYPAQNYSDWETVNLSGGQHDGITVTIDIDLGIDPNKLRREIVDLIEKVE